MDRSPTVLDELLEFESRKPKCGFAIDSKSYIRWVQTSLERAKLFSEPPDGLISPEYRDAVREFQRRRGIKPSGKFDRKTQNAVILANERNPTYVRWIQRGLNANGAKLRVDGIKGRTTTAAIKTFQRKHSPDLCIDGFVGAKTELRLIQSGAGAPPSGIFHDLCGVKRTARGTALELDLLDEFDELDLLDELERPRVAKAKPKAKAKAKAKARLCLFQNHEKHRNHFECGAKAQAKRVSAVQSPTATRCPKRVGATVYDTGADIIEAIQNARKCMEARVNRIDVFSHGFSAGIPGSTSGWAGLYQNDFSVVDRRAGGRSVSDVPAGDLANDVIVVLHGCKMGLGDDNIARSLYEHLAATLDNPKVFGHTDRGCAGRNKSWREYSNAHPTGKNRKTLRNIASTGCCDP